ncbi:MAG: hypothetical protein IJ733_09535 [Lachnospiraceae bacterium]|nr:hypothetical protein [Lachnospiraceae bacterium]
MEGLLLSGTKISKEDAIKKYQEESEKDGTIFLFLGIGLFIIVFLISMGFTALTGKMQKKKK